MTTDKEKLEHLLAGGSLIDKDTHTAIVLNAQGNLGIAGQNSYVARLHLVALEIPITLTAQEVVQTVNKSPC